MTVDVTTVTQYTETFVPFELFVLVFIFGMIFLILSIVAKKGNIIFSALSAIISVFLIYSTFFLRWNTTYVPTISQNVDGIETIVEITNVNQMFLSVPTLWLMIALFAFSVVTLWMNVGYYSEKALKDGVKKHKNLDDDGGML